MCTRTKTSYGCGHSHKTDLRCKSPSRCGGLERFHFQREGDCSSCREQVKSIKKQGKTAVLDRGRLGLGRYGKMMRGKSDGYGSDDFIAEISEDEEQATAQRRGRSTRGKMATGAAEERRALRQLRQTPTAPASQTPIQYSIVPSQPLRPTLRSYMSAPVKNPAPLFGEITTSAKHTPFEAGHGQVRSQSRRQNSVQSRSKSKSQGYDTRFGVTHSSATFTPQLQHHFHSPQHNSHHRHDHERASPLYTSQSRPRHSSTPRSSSRQPYGHAYNHQDLYRTKAENVIEVVQELSDSEVNVDSRDNVFIEERKPRTRASPKSYHHYHHPPHHSEQPYLQEVAPSIVEIDAGPRAGSRRSGGRRHW